MAPYPPRTLIVVPTPTPLTGRRPSHRPETHRLVRLRNGIRHELGYRCVKPVVQRRQFCLAVEGEVLAGHPYRPSGADLLDAYFGPQDVGFTGIDAERHRQEEVGIGVV